VQIAAQHSETVSEGSGVGVEERLLFDRVTLHSGNIAPGNVERATVVEANLADTGLSLGNRAAVAAGIAAYAIAIQLFPKGGFAFADALVRRQNVVQRGHDSILRLSEGLMEGEFFTTGSTGDTGGNRNEDRLQFASDFARWLWERTQTSARWRAAETCAWVIWEASPSSRALLFSSPLASAIADQK